MIRKVKFLAKEAILRTKYIMVKDCIFCKIISGDIKSAFLEETDKSVAILDINPVSDVHILILPKRHIDSVLTIGDHEGEDIIDMYKLAQKLVSDRKLDAFRLAFNGGKYQHVPHLHMHLLAGRKIEWTRL